MPVAKGAGLIQMIGLIVNSMGLLNYVAWLADQKILWLHIKVMANKFGWNELEMTIYVQVKALHAAIC